MIGLLSLIIGTVVALPIAARTLFFGFSTALPSGQMKHVTDLYFAKPVPIEENREIT
jgi:hypothetical protein